MSPKYADIIIDISHEAIDRTFQYKVPDRLRDKLQIGTKVSVPFGRGSHMRSGYVVSFSENPVFEEERIKEIADVYEGAVAVEDSLIELAAFIREQYGSTMINALKTVMPIREKVRGLTRRQVRLLIDRQKAEERLALYRKKNAKAKERLLVELMDVRVISYPIVTGKLNISSATLKAMEKEQVIAIEEEGYDREIFSEEEKRDDGLAGSGKECPNAEQNLLKGVTGSGKTLVYIEVIDRIVAMGKQAIVLIPEIALTYQTVKRFRKRFGDRVTIMNSRLSKGERYEQFEKAKKGEVSVIIGPRSALFAPFPNLGLIVVDEEHETSYKSEYPPKYHAREVAIKRGQMAGASVLLGSATPSVESYYHALNGDYKLLTLSKRAKEDSSLARVFVADMREELKRGNRGIFSNRLQELMRDRLDAGQQIMLFLNRRGHTGFISCRSCGHVFKCPHCDVSLTSHFSGTNREKLVCHYCGYEQKRPALCPECQSRYIGGFGVGTQKVEEEAAKLFPGAKVLRMDMDTTRNKDAHEQILSRFANGEADILVGTQMIVKGHDFSNVTLVGVVAADLTLFENDYRSAERTFDLLTQAAGRAGRGSLKGDVVIQTYAPEHYCIETAAGQDYQAFYEAEKAYRELLAYPPFTHVLAVFMEQEDYDALCSFAGRLAEKLTEWGERVGVRLIGPCDATIVKINDRYRRVIYLKHKEYAELTKIKDRAEAFLESRTQKGCQVTFDFDPLHSY